MMDIETIREQAEDSLRKRGMENNDLNDGLPREWRNLIHSQYRLEAQVTGNLLLIKNEVCGIREELRAARLEHRQLVQGGALLIALSVLTGAIILGVVGWLT